MKIEKESRRIVRMSSKERKTRQFAIFRFLKDWCQLRQFSNRELFKAAKKYAEYWDLTAEWLEANTQNMIEDLYAMRALAQCDCPECGGMTWQIVDAERVE